MTRRLFFTLSALLFFTPPVFPQSPCSDCFYTAEVEVQKCLDNAISAGDKNSCLENRRVRLKACSDNQCQTVREAVATTEAPATPPRPGLAPYMPSEGEWLAVVMRAGLRREASPDRPYSLDIVLADPQTLQIIVHHAATMDRAQVKNVLETAKDAIRSTARSYGWDKWVKIRETVEMYAAKK